MMLSSLRVASSYLIRNNNSNKSPAAAAASRRLTASGVVQQQQQQTKLNLNNNFAYFSSSSSSGSSSSSDGGSGSHDDFAPKRKVVEGEDEALEIIKQHVESNPIMLYMKGNPSLPMCGFSAKVVQALKDEEVDFGSVNVLDYPDIREGIKKFSDWPTIPQLYVNGEFIGGCDIVTSMHESGELTELLKEVSKDE